MPKALPNPNPQAQNQSQARESGRQDRPDDQTAPFWRAKKMSEMTAKEWESLCDGCGRCCLNKLTDVDTAETVYTDVGCKLLDGRPAAAPTTSTARPRCATACG